MHQKGFIRSFMVLALLLLAGAQAALASDPPGPCPKPFITGISPSGGTHSPNAAGNIILSANVFLATSVDFFIDGSRVATDTASPWAFAWPARAGSHQFFVRAFNSCGSATSSTVTFTVNCGLPSVSLTQPAHGSTVTPNASGNVILSASASHSTGIRKVEFFVDGTRVATDQNGPPWAFAWPATTGSHQAFALATSICGSSKASLTNSFTVN